MFNVNEIGNKNYEKKQLCIEGLFFSKLFHYYVIEYFLEIKVKNKVLLEVPYIHVYYEFYRYCIYLSNVNQKTCCT